MEQQNLKNNIDTKNIKHSGLFHALHGIAFSGILFQIVSGLLYKRSEVFSGADFYLLHRSIGLTVFLAVLLMCIKFPQKIFFVKNVYKSNKANIISALGSVFIIGLSLILPFVGYLMNDASGTGNQYFGIVLPTILEYNERAAHIYSKMHIGFAHLLSTILIIKIVEIVARRGFAKVA